MKQKLLILMTAGLLTVSGVALARNTTLHLPLAAVLAMPQAQSKLDPSVTIFLQGSAHPEAQKELGSGMTNRKTNAMNKSDDQACRWAALDALLALQNGAKAHGANAVVNVVSYYDKKPFASPTDYECHAGGVVAGVALKGDYVVLGAAPAAGAPAAAAPSEAAPAAAPQPDAPQSGAPQTGAPQ